jgi:prevent-host-death family protein
MIRIAASEARKRFSDLVSKAAHQGQRIVLTHYGKAVAALVPITDLPAYSREGDGASGRPRSSAG